MILSSISSMKVISSFPNPSNIGIVGSSGSKKLLPHLAICSFRNAASPVCPWRLRSLIFWMRFGMMSWYLPLTRASIFIKARRQQTPAPTKFRASAAWHPMAKSPRKSCNTLISKSWEVELLIIRGYLHHEIQFGAGDLKCYWTVIRSLPNLKAFLSISDHEPRSI